MNDYTYNDMMRMQDEAKRRVLEMQKRSRNITDSFNNSKRENEGKSEEELPRVPRAVSLPAGLHGNDNKEGKGHSHGKNNKTDLRNTLYSVFGSLSDDDYEKMFILSLCLLLSKENKDDSLILALMYILS